MLKKALLPVLLALMLGCGALFGCSEPETSAEADADVATENGPISVDIAVTPGLLASTPKAESFQPYEQVKSVKLDAGSTVYDALVADKVDVEGEPSSITAINGVGNSKGKEWLFTVNGEPGTGSPDTWEVHDGDVIIWYYGVPEDEAALEDNGDVDEYAPVEDNGAAAEE